MKVCVDCQQDVVGKKAVKVKEDKTIRMLRGLKRFLRIAKENDLYVCEADLEKHLERRKSFEKTMLIFAAIAAFIVVLLFVAILLSGRFEILTIISAILIGIFLFLFSVIFKYVPAVESLTPELVAGGKPEQKPVRKTKKKKKGGK